MVARSARVSTTPDAEQCQADVADGDERPVSRNPIAVPMNTASP